MPQIISVRDGKVMVNYVQEGTIHSSHQAAMNAADKIKTNRYPAATIQDLGESLKPKPKEKVIKVKKVNKGKPVKKGKNGKAETAADAVTTADIKETFYAIAKGIE